MRATTAQVSGDSPLPAGLLVEGARAAIARVFPALCALQPVRESLGGLICAPRAAPELARAALARCPLPVRPLAEVPGWPDPPAAFVAGWYRRSPGHAPSPPGLRELVQAPGEGFGPHDHPTTAMCLAALERLPPGPAVDVGCGSGLLAQAWARLGRGHVVAYDIDPRALEQAARSLALAGLGERVRLRQGAAEGLAPEALAGRVLLANLPLPAQWALAAGRGPAPRAALLSGIRRGDAGPLLSAWRARGLRPVAASRRGRFVCWALVGP